MHENTNDAGEPVGTETQSDSPAVPVFDTAPTAESNRATPRWLLPAAMAAVGVAIGAVCGSVITGAVIAADTAAQEQAAAQAAEEARSTRFADAARECGISGKVEVLDDGQTLLVDGAGKDFGSGDVTFTELDCIIGAVGAPESARSKMYETRSLDGRQSAEWDGVSASWSYHPDDGLDLIFELKK